MVNLSSSSLSPRVTFHIEANIISRLSTRHPYSSFSRLQILDSILTRPTLVWQTLTWTILTLLTLKWVQMGNQQRQPMKMIRRGHLLVEVPLPCLQTSRLITIGWTAIWRELKGSFLGLIIACLFVKRKRSRKCHIRDYTLESQALPHTKMRSTSTSRSLIVITAIRYRSSWTFRDKGWSIRENKGMNRGENKTFDIGCYLKTVVILRPTEQRKVLFYMTWILTNCQRLIQHLLLSHNYLLMLSNKPWHNSNSSICYNTTKEDSKRAQLISSSKSSTWIPFSIMNISLARMALLRIRLSLVQHTSTSVENMLAPIIFSLQALNSMTHMITRHWCRIFRRIWTALEKNQPSKKDKI